MSNLANIKLEVLQRTFLRWSRDWYKKVDILKKWLHDFCPHFVRAMDIKGFSLGGCLLVERSNWAYIKPEVLQSTFWKLSRHWYQKISILKDWLYDFCPNLIVTIDIKQCLFKGRLLIERSNLAIVKLKVLQSTFLKWSREW